MYVYVAFGSKALDHGLSWTPLATSVPIPSVPTLLPDPHSTPLIISYIEKKCGRKTFIV